MIMLLLPFLFSLAWGSAPSHWSTLLEIRERHEFYQDNEVISKPKGAWQTLFAVIYPDRALKLHKDCVYYRVPGELPGVLKLKAAPLEKSCESFMDLPGDLEVINLKSLQFSFSNELIMHFTFADYRSLKWTIPLMNQFKSETPAPFTSSAVYRAPKLTLLAPVRPVTEKKEVLKQTPNELCHSINDECEELQPSACHQCSDGWYEVPNGCQQGPKYCGSQSCGLKNQPACRRGMKHQRVRKKYECRIDSSFAYCAPGLTVQCEGSRAFCR
ncbi:MAG TPA: hypothetical protein VNJ08_15935 [Bacteriovoracaceae bacterium]|nr:hypothetical protein [Bacteriovoracaceae bacterium]